jgi:myosin heavy subunit
VVELQTLRASFTKVGILPPQQLAVFRLLAAIMWLGNVEFGINKDDSANVTPSLAFSAACQLLELSPEAAAR